VATAGPVAVACRWYYGGCGPALVQIVDPGGGGGGGGGSSYSSG